jgi:hypothetical protein
MHSAHCDDVRIVRRLPLAGCCQTTVPHKIVGEVAAQARRRIEIQLSRTGRLRRNLRIDLLAFWVIDLRIPKTMVLR